MNKPTANFGSESGKDQAAPKAKEGIAAFYTVPKHTEGRLLNLILPDGKPSGHWIVVRGHYDPACEKAFEEYKQKLLINAAKPPSEQLPKAAFIIDVRTPMVAAWNFDEPCTPENIKTFFEQAPQVAVAVDKFCWEDSNFLN